jgi:hypothetical protein
MKVASAEAESEEAKAKLAEERKRWVALAAGRGRVTDQL